MEIKEFIATLKQSNFTLSVENDKLILKGDKKNLSKDELNAVKSNEFIINYIKENKSELIEYISFLSGNTSVDKRTKNITAIYRLSGLQQGMLFHGLYGEGAEAYMEQFGCDLGNVDLDILNQSWDHVIKSHSILRTSFNYDAFKVPVQCVHQSVKLPVELLDFREMNEAVQSAAIKAYEKADLAKEFDFNVAPLMRLGLLRLNEERYRMIWTSHHILFDGWSLPILMGEFLSAYEQLKSGEALVPGEEDRFEDYIRYIDRIDKVQEEAYWRNYLNGVEHSTLLPFIGVATDRNKGVGEYQTLGLLLDTATTSKINQFAQRRRLTVNTIIQGVWAYLLHQYTGNKDVVYGVIVSGRPDDMPGVEQRVGMYINALPFHSVLDEGQEIVQWLQGIQAEQVSSRQYQFTPLHLVQGWSGIHGDWFDTLMTFENFPVNKMLGARQWSLQVENVHLNEHTNYPLNIIIESAEQINVSFNFNKGLLNEAQVNSIRGHFENVLLQLIEKDDSKIAGLSLLTTAEEKQLLVAFNNTGQEYAHDKTINGLFEEQALKTPDSVAVVYQQEQLTYRELNERSNQLAHYLAGKGIRKEMLVPICIERGIDMIVGLLGVLKTGAAYVPVDPDYPEDRIQYMLEDTAASIMVSSSASRSKITGSVNLDIIEIDSDWPVISHQPKGNPGIATDPHLLAYTIYTSGSTGKPKGVMIEHTSVINLLQSIAKDVQFNADAAFMSVTTFSFDICYLELYMPLISGGKLIVLSREDAMDGFKLSGHINRYHPTHMQGTPSTWQLLLDANWQNKEGLKMLVGGEAVKEDLKSALTQKGSVWNVYGPTETTIWSTIKKLETSQTVLIGKPVANTNIQIVNQQGQLVPVGVAGEILIGGAGLARGYYKRPELTAEKFISDHFSKSPGARMYRTGDLGRWLPDGNIECLGRIDEQVKIRGYRIELGEIETVLQQSGLVSQSVVLAKEDSGGNKRLVGYIVADTAVDKQAIMAHLRTKLPDYMVPALWIELENLPLTPNGKINKKALPDPDTNDLAGNEYIPARNEQEAWLVKLWQDLLKVERIGVNDNFFELGGHSLLAMRLVSIIRKEMEVEIPIKSIFLHSTISALAVYLDTHKKGLLLPVIMAQPRPELIPLSFSQERLWFIDRLEGSVQYHIPAVLRISGTLNKDALANTLKAIVNRHEVLRTVIREKEGRPYQHIINRDGWQLTEVDGAMFRQDAEGLLKYIEQLKNEPFNLSVDYMLRAHLITLNEEAHVLVVTQHHIASDGWSISVLVKEVVALYSSYNQDREPDLAPLEIQYADYSLWQRNHLQGDLLNTKLGYWKDKLQDVKVLRLPTDYTRPAVQSTRGAMVNVEIGKELTGQLKSFSRQQGSTLFMTLLSAFKVLLYRYTEQNDICVGTAIAGRQSQQLEALIGFFVNTLALRTEVNGDATFLSLLQEVKKTTLDAYEHQELPFEKVVEAVVGKRDLGTDPLVQVMFVLQNTPDIPELKLGESTLSADNYEDNTALFEIWLNMVETPDGLKGFVKYSTDLYSKETMERFVSHFSKLLSSIIAHPDHKLASLEMLSLGERNQLLLELNDAGITYPKDKTIVSIFEEQVKITPANIALVFEDEQVTYSELNERSNQLAHYLVSKGVAAETLVPICIDRGIELIVAIIGILKAGGVYVPIDPDYPQERIQYMLEDTGAGTVITSREHQSKLNGDHAINIIEIDGDWKGISQQPSTNLPTVIEPNQLAYIIYTSGSTGMPKGVLIEHRNVVRLFMNEHPLYVFTEKDVWCMFHSPSFDFSVWEMYGALFYGGRLVVVPKAVTKDIALFANLLIEQQVTILNQTPSAFYVLQDILVEKVNTIPIRYVIFGGEALNPARLQPWKESFPGCRLINMYGITETTVHVTYQEIGWEQIRDGKSVIGKPIPTLSAFILDSHRNLLPVGVVGELCIGGAGLARGYLNRPELTAEKFVHNPLGSTDDSRLYMSGDLGRWLPDGTIEYLGRKDEQVKIRGYRIELGEVEAAINKLELVNSSCVVVKKDISAASRLVTYYVPNWQEVKQKERELYLRLVASWKELYETEYAKTEVADDVDHEFNIIGWNDSFTGQPIPAGDMREWLRDIIDVIMSEKPGYVLEIGSGTGLIYYQLAGKVKKYNGADFSRSSISQITDRISKGLRDYGPTELQVSAAHEVVLKEGEPIDTVILNSIIQYFPGEDYMTDVIGKSISFIKDKGRIIVGDVRDNRLLELFKGRLQIKKLQESVDIKEFKWSMGQEMLKEEELCLSPDYFYNLQSRFPRITHIEIKWKHGAYINELTLYRFTVIIYVGMEAEVYQPEWQNWKGISDQQAILDELQRGNIVAVKDVPNPRLWQERLLSKGLEDKSLRTVGDLLNTMNREDAETIKVNELLAAVLDKGYSYRLLLDEDIFKVNLVFEPTASNKFIEQPYHKKAVGSGVLFANIPLFNEISLLFQKEIKGLLQQSLPDYMVPSEIISVGHLPLTNNGKVDRKFLSQKEEKGNSNKFNYVAPRNETEQVLATIWQELLGVDSVSIHDNFFEIGGHSLLVTRVISAIRRQMGIEVAIKDFFVHPTIAALAVELQLLSGEVVQPPIEIITRPEHIPLSYSQERLWFIDQLEGSVQYHVPVVLLFKGHLDSTALSSALQGILTRHEVLRTVFREKGGRVYQSVMETAEWSMQLMDGAAYKQDQQRLKKYTTELIRKPFDLSKDYLLRADLIKLDELEHVAVVTMHHIASDAWSLSILVKEVAELYSSFTEQRPALLPELSVQYADYSIWQRSYLQGQVLDKKLAYWKEKLNGNTPLQLPADYPRPATGSTRGAATGFKIDKALTGSLKELSQQNGVTLFMTLLSVFKVLLHRYSSQEDISVGTSISNRPQEEVEGLVGFFVNTLTLRTELNGGMSFAELLQSVKDTTLGAYEHQDVPFEKVVEAVVKERDMSRSPLFQVMLVLLNTPEITELRLGDLELSQLGFDAQISKFDITYFMTETPNGLQCSIEYSTDLYKVETIEKMMVHYQQLLNAVVKNPQQNLGLLPMLSVAEETQLLEGDNIAAVVYPKDKTVVDLFEEQVNKTPEAPAIIFEDEQLTYQQLNERANQLAHYLRSRGVKEDTLVPLYVERGIEMMVGMMGILKAGAAYVPIDTDFPQDRISYMLEDAAAKIVVSSSNAGDQLEAASGVEIIETDGTSISYQPNSNLSAKPLADNLAYTIYTSGSTGKPKGVMVTHNNLVDYYFGLNKYTAVDQCKSFALVSTIATDLGNTVIYGSLLSGGALHLFTKETVSNIEALHQYFNRHTIDCLKIVPSHWKALSQDEGMLIPKKLLIFGGEALQSELAENILSAASGCRVFNHYGPTETTIGKLMHEVKPGNSYGKTIPIGKPFSNTRVYVLSKELQPCPVGVPGQLYIAGDGVAKGYFNNETLTTEKFIADPFNKQAGGKMYGTGDLVKYLPDGNISFIGRVDDQVKIRGYRVEPGEIESILQQSEWVKEAVVLAKEDQQGNRRLVGYIVPQDAFEREAILDELKEKLPEYMVPSILVELESLPLTANGKVDRKALPDPDATELLSGRYIAPRNEVEERLAAIWADILEVEQVGVHDDFFELGGHSLLAVRLISAIRKAFSIEMPIGDIFDYPTVALLAGQVEKPSGMEVLPVIQVDSQRPALIPLSFSQERLWFIDRMEGSVQYHVPTVLRLKGKLNEAILANTLQQVVNRHEVLRTVFVEEEGQAWQQVNPANGWQLTTTDGEKYNNNPEALQQYVREIIDQPFDLSKDHMLRVQLITLTEAESILVVVIHHIASDGWSTSVLVKEVVELYSAYEAGREPILPQLAIQYADFATWQRNYLQGDLLDKKIAYWKTKLQGVAPLQLPTDHTRPPVQGNRGALKSFRISKAIAADLQQLGQQHGATLFMTLLSAFKVLLHRYSGQEDICVGTPIAGRQQQETENLIGFFVNTLALRSGLNSNESFTDLLQQIKGTTMEAYQHQEVPFEKVVEVVSKERDLSRSPLFQVMFVLRNTPEIPAFSLGEVNLTRENFYHTTSQFDLTLFVTETERGLQCAVEYNTDLFVADTIEKFTGHFTNLLESILQQPAQKIGLLPMLSQSEEKQLLYEFNDTDVEYPSNKTIIEIFENQVNKTPSEIALVFENESLTYDQLNERSNQLAYYLQKNGVRAGMLVPVSIERSLNMIISVLAILKAGAVYTPVDPEYPAERIVYMLEDAGAEIVISSKATGPILPLPPGVKLVEVDGADQDAVNSQPTTNLSVKVDADHLVYLIYTSGSTGKPKGVKMGGRGMVNLLTWQEKQFSNKKRRVLQFASLNFDVSFQEIFSTLCYGSCLYLINGDRRRDMAELLKDIGNHQLTHLFIPYIVLKNLVEYILPLSINSFPVEEIIVAGEQLKLTDDIQSLLRISEVRIINQYGPTEAHVVSSYSIDSKGELAALPPIGKPIDNTKLYILGELGQLVPVDVPGELFIGGVQVAQGYLNLPELTGERFVENPFNKDAGNRLYKTGDIARWMKDGNIEYLGRKDDQVKIRGFRVELGEIESILQECSLVRQAAVLAKESNTGSKRLIAYIVPEVSFDKAAILTFLKEQLPEYMVPSQLLEMEFLPVTRNGKIDRKALPDPEGDGLLQKEYLAPVTETEKLLAEIWQGLLKAEKVGVNDNFFELGGHSLLVVKMVAVIKKQFGLAIPIPVLFQFPTVRELANYMDWENTSSTGEEDESTFEIINL